MSHWHFTKSWFAYDEEYGELIHLQWHRDIVLEYWQHREEEPHIKAWPSITPTGWRLVMLEWLDDNWVVELWLYREPHITRGSAPRQPWQNRE